MPQQELIEEIDAIEAIYPDSVTKLAPEIFNFTIPNRDEVTIQMSFPVEYPEVPPIIIQAFTKNVRKYPDNSYIEKHISSILEDIYHTGDVVIFELLGEIDIFLEAYEIQHQELIDKINAQLKKLHMDEMRAKFSKIEHKEEVKQVSKQREIDVTEGWIQSDPVLDRGSTFIAFTREVHSVEEARMHFELLITDRKIAKAAHNMNTWRIKGANGVTYQDCDDDGEAAAGLRMLHLLTVRQSCSLD